MALLASPLIAGCAVHSDATIQSSTGNAAGMREIALLSSDADQGLRIGFAERLAIAFRARDVPANPKAEIMGDFAVSAMPADMSLATSKPQTANSGASSDVAVQSKPRIKRLLDRCEAVRYRATLVLFNRSSSERLYHAQGESEGCADDAAPLNELADLLVRDALLAPN